MSEKRRDSKNRIFRNGESQRKDGRYAYKYIDATGKPQFVYSWKLEATDSTPTGKRDGLSLREKEKQIRRDIEDAIIPRGGEGYSSIHSIRGVDRPAFQMAVDDDLIRKNPFEFQLAIVVVNDSVTREAITRKQERTFLEFVKGDKHFSRYYDGIYILFKTGLRISEFVGLTLADLDMKNRKISVNHQFQRKRSMEYVIEDTKTSSGTREFPMTDDVYQCFQRIIANRPKPKTEPMIDGRCGFPYLDKDGKPMVALHWEHYFKHICQSTTVSTRCRCPKPLRRKAAPADGLHGPLQRCSWSMVLR